MRTKWKLALGTTLAILVVAGCAEKGPAAAPPASAEQQAAEVGPPRPWDDLTFDQRKQYMREHVAPTMQAKFQAFDPDEYADFGCGTCHGKDMKERKFSMPNPGLPVLPTPGSPKWEKMMGKPSGIVHFMVNTVEPTMADLLDIPPYDPKTNEGFGCFDCHTMAAAEGPADATEPPAAP